MTQEQIDALEDAMLYQDWGRVVRVIAMGNTASAERALLWSHEWAVSIGGKENGGNLWWYWMEDGTDKSLRVDRAGWAFVGNEYVRTIRTRGDLLDLLSGLGVRK